MSLILSSGKQEIIFNRPLMNSAGMLGFSDETRHWINLQALGAFITNPTSLYPRAPARAPNATTGDYGALLHTGLPNPGIDQVIKIHHMRWNRMPIPVILHIIAQAGEEITAMLDRLEGLHSVQAIEIGLQGEEFALDREVIQAALTGILPVIVRLPMDTHIEKLKTFEELGVAAIALGPPRGTVFENGERVSGRLYGPALLPQMINCIEQAIGFLSCPLIAGSGIFNRADAERLLSMGVQAMQLDTVLWTDPDQLIEPPISYGSDN